MLYKAEMWKWKAERFSGLTCKVWGSSIENYYSTRLFIAKVIPRQGRKVTCKRAKSKLVWDFAASTSNLLNGTVSNTAESPADSRPLCEVRPNIVRQLYFPKNAVRSAIRSTLLTAERLAAARFVQASKNQACLGFATSAAKARQRQWEGRTSYIAQGNSRAGGVSESLCKRAGGNLFTHKASAAKLGCSQWCARVPKFFVLFSKKYKIERRQ